ncbi:MAG: hypothetical protein EAZ43_13615 [Betaproteobacteria bacterium]|nr:MAG: hypothetical protein EAZ43_13615 [Betaproteobacteria bacterium]
MKNRSFTNSLAAVVLATACLSGSMPASADTSAIGHTLSNSLAFDRSILLVRPNQYSCPLATGNSSIYFASRDIQLSSYNGWSIDTVTIRYWAAISGTYSFRIVIRDTDRYGNVISRSTLRTVTLAAATPLNVTTRLGNAWTGRTTRLSISHEDTIGPASLYFTQSPGACSNSALTESTGAMPGPAADIGLVVTGDSAAAHTEVVEYYIASTNKYFMTGRAAEQTVLDGASPQFVRTGKKFTAPSTGVYGNVDDVHRLYLAPPAGPQHILVDKLDRDTILATPGSGWVDEGAQFSMTKPSPAGVCPSYAPKKIYRSFNNATVVSQRSYRYSTTLADHNAMLALGWLDERAVFCAYN